MEWITFVKKENAKKAEDILKGDTYLAAKESITVKDAHALDMKEEGSFFLISGTDEGVKKCKELIKEFVEKIEEEKLEEAKKKIREEEDQAAEAMGGVFNI
jgi:uncharacterized protein YaaR (DUF327 family)